jgi:E3 ubiquitin-protein ligase HUWE1
LIDKLKNCVDNEQLFNELCTIKSWNIGKCELYHWADVLDLFDTILESSCAKTSPESWQLACDLPENFKVCHFQYIIADWRLFEKNFCFCSKVKKLLLAILQFTALLIEHSYSRHLYNSIEYLTTLLESTDFYVILSVLNLLYVFSKRSVFINRLAADKKQALIQRLLYLAEVSGLTRVLFKISVQTLKKNSNLIELGWKRKRLGSGEMLPHGLEQLFEQFPVGDHRQL